MSEPDRRPTIVDVAQDAGVSKSLVSRAVRGQPGVSDSTRARILASAERLGYRSNPWARSLKRGTTDLVGVLLTDLQNAYHVEVADGVEDVASHRGLGVVLSHGRGDPDVLRERLVSLQRLGVDGLVVVSALLDGAELLELAAGTPLVVVGRPRGMPPRLDSVRNDDEWGARLVVEHLLALGHRRVAHVMGSSRPAARARRRTYEQVMSTVGLADRIRVVDSDHVSALVAEVASGSLDSPTAVFASNDRTAARVHAAALDTGLAVPGDLSVVGYDNTGVASVLRPGLTTVDQSRELMGRHAMEQLATRMAGDRQRAQHVVLRPELVVRGSSAPPP